MFVNSKKVGHAPQPLARPGFDKALNKMGSWKATPAMTSIRTRDVTGRVISQAPPMLMVGCHRNSDDDDFKDFGYNATYDELAIWVYKLVTNQTTDQALLFTGGYSMNSSKIC